LQAGGRPPPHPKLHPLEACCSAVLYTAARCSTFMRRGVTLPSRRHEDRELTSERLYSTTDGGQGGPNLKGCGDMET